MRKSQRFFGDYWTYGICAILVVAAGIAFQVGAQGPPETGQRIGGMATTKAVIPPTKARPSESPDRPLDAERAPGDGETVSSFVETLQGADSAFQIVLGQSRMLTTREPIAKDGKTATIAVGDPTVVDFEVLSNPRLIRLVGLRAGVTDLTFTTSDHKTYSFEVHVTYDLELIRAQLRQAFPDASVRLGQIREHLVVEGQARSTDQVALIVQTLEYYLTSLNVKQSATQQQTSRNALGGMGNPGAAGAGVANPQANANPSGDALMDEPMSAAPVPNDDDNVGVASALGADRPNTKVTLPKAQIINLLTVPGVQQVLLQVQIAELNRTALREIGVDWLLRTPNATVGTNIAGAVLSKDQDTGAISQFLGDSTTAFGIFPSGQLSLMVRALRRNAVMNVLAEPNLVTMNGQEASFLAGGEFAVPVPQPGGSAGGTSVTIQYKQFGVQLNFVPYIQDDDTIRLKVAPEASSIDYSLGTQVLGTSVPGINTRRLNTTVQLRQGQTLALAGLLSVEMDGTTSRIPLLGDLPYIGVMFSNNSHRRIEKELVVLVTPHLIAPMNQGQVPCVPGDDVFAPNDLEFYLLGRVEGRVAKPFYPTRSWDNPLGLVEFMKLESSRICGPNGFSQTDE